MNPENQPRTHTPAHVEPAALEAVADAMAGLRGLASIPTAAHVPVFERVHVTLTDALSAIDEV